MPFTLTPNQFKAPVGEFEPEMFPAGDIDSRLNAWINLAAAAVADLDASVQERAAIAYVEYRGWGYVATVNQQNPDSITLDSGRTAIKFSASQRNYFQSRANQAKAIYDEYFTFEEEFIA